MGAGTGVGVVARKVDCSQRLASHCIIYGFNYSTRAYLDHTEDILVMVAGILINNVPYI